MMTSRIFTDSLLILLLYGCAWIVNGQAVFKNYDYIKEYKKTSAIFIVATIIVVFIFYRQLAPFFENFTIVPFLFLLLFYIAVYMLYRRMKILIDSKTVEKHKASGLYLTAMDHRFLVSKSFDILFQQILALIALALLKDMGVNLVWIILFFIAIVTFSHFTIIKKNFHYGVYTTINSPLAVIISLFLILYIHYGFVYSYILHWVYYLIGGVGFIILKKRQSRKFLM